MEHVNRRAFIAVAAVAATAASSASGSAKGRELSGAFTTTWVCEDVPYETRTTQQLGESAEDAAARCLRAAHAAMTSLTPDPGTYISTSDGDVEVQTEVIGSLWILAFAEHCADAQEQWGT